MNQIFLLIALALASFHLEARESAAPAYELVTCQSYHWNISYCDVNYEIKSVDTPFDSGYSNAPVDFNNPPWGIQVSTSQCEEGKSFGWTKNQIWVTYGCRAVFRVNYVKVPQKN